MKSGLRPSKLINDSQTGSLKVPGASQIAKPILELLSYPFTLKIATRDWHPQNHISFASNHNGTTAFVNKTRIFHPKNHSLSYETTLWPDHCVQNTHGAELVPALNGTKFNYTVDKGQRSDVEMYSAFWDPFKVSISPLLEILRNSSISHVYVVGLAADFCVNATAQDAHAEGFQTVIVDEGTRAVFPDMWLNNSKAITASGVPVVSLDGKEVERVRALDPNGASRGIASEDGGRVSNDRELPTGPDPKDPKFKANEPPSSN